MTTAESVKQIVARVWRTEIGLPDNLTPTEQEQFLDREGERIENLIEELVPGQGPLVEDYRATHGTAPDYLTTVQLITMARHQATEQVLTAELYEQIPEPSPEFEPTQTLEELEETEQQIAAARIEQARGDRDRWRRALDRSEPTPEVEALVSQLWPHRTAWFRVAAQYLIQARSEDNEPIPAGPQDQLVAEFTSQVEQELQAKGRVRDAEHRQ
ncbi:hypothetical protein [Nocardia sp. 348MFTsu5.1]|uniref:hypothetical protein n=1 Tax=Nocardia sp. 348MFTsu5.1 TaxID=1172185 RepID=UPI001E3C3B2B|nr:hypothetical protein [Nocardia sp. 348MFTsu5.1]